MDCSATTWPSRTEPSTTCPRKTEGRSLMVAITVIKSRLFCLFNWSPPRCKRYTAYIEFTVLLKRHTNRQNPPIYYTPAYRIIHLSQLKAVFNVTGRMGNELVKKRVVIGLLIAFNLLCFRSLWDTSSHSTDQGST